MPTTGVANISLPVFSVKNIFISIELMQINNPDFRLHIDDSLTNTNEKKTTMKSNIHRQHFLQKHYLAPLSFCQSSHSTTNKKNECWPTTILQSGPLNLDLVRHPSCDPNTRHNLMQVLNLKIVVRRRERGEGPK